MHTFQPYPIDLMEMNPFTKIGKEWMLITAGDEKKANTMTASWGGVGAVSYTHLSANIVLSYYAQEAERLGIASVSYTHLCL